MIKVFKILKNTVWVNGIKGRDFLVSTYIINNNNYIKLRDLACILKNVNSNKQFELEWDGTAKAVKIYSSKDYTLVGGELEIQSSKSAQTANVSTCPFYLDGIKIELAAYSINNNNYIKLHAGQGTCPLIPQYNSIELYHSQKSQEP